MSMGADPRSQADQIEPVVPPARRYAGQEASQLAPKRHFPVPGGGACRQPWRGTGMAVQVESAKWVPETDFLVDGFRFACERCEDYFLTHAHADHTTGLTRGFSRGTIYCTEITARVVHHVIGVSPQFFSEFRLDVPRVVAGIEVTAVDANHCPGAVQFVFKLPSGRVLLHTGDFRYDPAMESLAVWRRLGRPHTVFLDTTYCVPRYKFPTQRDTVALVIYLMRAALAREPDTLFLIGTYSIGKERVLIGAARALGLRVYVPPKKRKLLECLGLHEEDVFTDDPAQARIRAAPLSLLAFHDMGRMARAGTRPAPQGGEAHNTGGAGGAGGTDSTEGRGEGERTAASGPGGQGRDEGLTTPQPGSGGAKGEDDEEEGKDEEEEEEEEEDMDEGDDEEDEAATPSAATATHSGAGSDRGGGSTGAAGRGEASAGLASDESGAVCGADVGRYKAVVGFRPTGWSFSKTKPYSEATEGACTLYGVPYSEHSSFDELRAYIRFLRPKRLVPTVGGETPRARDRILSRFADLMDLSEDRSRLDAYFGGPSPKPRTPRTPAAASPVASPPAAATRADAATAESGGIKVSEAASRGEAAQRDSGPHNDATGANAGVQAPSGANGSLGSGEAATEAVRDCVTEPAPASQVPGPVAASLDAIDVAEQYAILRAIRERQAGRKRPRTASAESTPSPGARRPGALRRSSTQSSLERFFAK